MIKVGDRFKTHLGDECVVVNYLNYDNITVEFCDKYEHKLIVKGCTLKNGLFKNPFAPRLFNVGYHGVGKHKSTNGSKRLGHKNLPAYSAWTNMLSRCYDKNYIDPELYENSVVISDWHNFQVFAEWYTSELNYVGWEGRINTDKDVIGNGTIYSPDTCCLVPSKVNTSITKSSGGKYLQGVLKSGENFRVIPGHDISNLKFKTELDAHIAFVESKSKKVIEIANEYKDKIKPIVYETLCTKDFRYKFSPYFENTQFP